MGLPRVFIVEDEALIALELEDLLCELGYSVCGHAARGDSAVVQVPAVKPDILLLDVSLAGALTGVDVLVALRGIWSGAILLITAYSDLVRRDPRADGVPVLLKPFSRDSLRESLSSFHKGP